MKKLLFGLFCFVWGGSVWAETAAPLPFEVIVSEPCRVQLVKWHKRDDGWLLTCRLATVRKSLVKPVGRLELRGYDPLEVDEGDEVEEVEQEPSWVQQKRVFRKDFDKKAGNLDAQFVRLIVQGTIPSTVERLELEFINAYSQ